HDRHPGSRARRHAPGRPSGHPTRTAVCDRGLAPARFSRKILLIRKKHYRTATGSFQAAAPSITREGAVVIETLRFACCLAVGSLFALASGMGFVSPAGAQTLGPLVQVTGLPVTAPDPFSDCTADRVHSQEAAFGSILYPNTAIEPWVAVDPT